MVEVAQGDAGNFNTENLIIIIIRNFSDLKDEWKYYRRVLQEFEADPENF